MSLTKREAVVLEETLRRTRGRERFLVAVLYGRQTPSSPRVPEAEYVSLPGASADLHVGELVSSRQDREGHVVVLLRDLARSNGFSPGLTSLRVDGLQRFRVIARGGIASPSSAPLSRSRHEPA